MMSGLSGTEGQTWWTSFPSAVLRPLFHNRYGKMVTDIMRLLRYLAKGPHFTSVTFLALLLVHFLLSLVLMVAESLSFGHALYLTAITGLTIGYGDIAPTTTVGRIVCVVIGLFGVIFVGMVVAVVNRALADAVAEMRQEETAARGDEGDR